MAENDKTSDPFAYGLGLCVMTQQRTVMAGLGVGNGIISMLHCDWREEDCMHLFCSPLGVQFYAVYV